MKTPANILFAFMLLGANLGTASAQTVSSTCFSYIYNATAADSRELLQSAISGFESAGCVTSLQPKVAGLTSSSPATADAAVFLLYRQSKKRLAVMAAQPPITVFSTASSSGGLIVGTAGPGGSLILKPVQPGVTFDIGKSGSSAAALKK